MNGERLNVGQLGMDFIILRNPIIHEPAEAELILSIDGKETRSEVYLPDGICPDCIETRISPLKVADRNNGDGLT
jgi:hypothetical protein